MTSRSLLQQFGRLQLQKTQQSTSSACSRGFRSSSSPVGGVPYTLHAQCSDNNTILTLSLSSPKDYYWSNTGVAKEGMAGRVVSRISSGMVGFKKGQRGTFEAGAGVTSAMMKLIAEIQNPQLALAEGQQPTKKNRNPAPKISELSIAFKGFGQGREALIAALTAAEGRVARMQLKRLQDVTPLKIGGGRPRKRRVL